MIHLISSISIEQPARQVFDFISTPENDFQWQYGTLLAATLPKRSGAAQTFFRTFGHLLGRRNLSTFEVTEYEPDKKYGFKSLSGPVHSSTFYLIEEIRVGTRLHIFIQACAPHFFQITERLLEKTMRAQLEENVSVLKSILETGTSAHMRTAGPPQAGTAE